MAVAYDNSVSATDFGVTTLTTAGFTIGAGADRAAIIDLATLADPGVVTVSLGGVSAEAIPNAAGNDASWYHRLFKVLDPPSGNQTLTASWQNAASAQLTGITATGASDVNGGVYGQAASNNVSLDIASNAGDLTASFSGDGNTGTAHSTNQTVKVTGQLIAADVGSGTAGPITHTWTHTGAFACNAVGANFVAVPAPSPSPTTTTPTPAGISRKRRLYVEIDGQHFQVRSVAEATQLLQQARALAERQAETKAQIAEKRLRSRPKVPAVRVDAPAISVSPDLLADVRPIIEDITRLYEKAAQAAELRLLLAKQQQEADDDDEAVLMLI